MARNMKCSTTGKDVHFTLIKAEKSAAQYKRNHGVKLRTYQCPDCHWWHLTKGRATKMEEIRT